MFISFFPDPIFAWSFVAVLLGFLGVASYTDWRFLRVPKRLTLPALGLGVLFNLVRGVWLGAEGLETWALGENGAFVGALDSLLFSLVGFVLGFGLFFLMWILGVCGGGD